MGGLFRGAKALNGLSAAAKKVPSVKPFKVAIQIFYFSSILLLYLALDFYL